MHFQQYFYVHAAWGGFLMTRSVPRLRDLQEENIRSYSTTS